MKRSSSDRGGGSFRSASDDGVPSRSASEARLKADAHSASLTIAELALEREWESDEERNESVRTALDVLGLVEDSHD